MTGNGEWLVAGRRGCSVLDLSGQVFKPVLQVLLVGAHHGEAVKHGTCRVKEYDDENDSIISLLVKCT